MFFTGAITFENLKKVSKILDISLTDEELEEMIEDADKDMDGEVLFTYFIPKTNVNRIEQ